MLNGANNLYMISQMNIDKILINILLKVNHSFNLRKIDIQYTILIIC